MKTWGTRVLSREQITFKQMSQGRTECALLEETKIHCGWRDIAWRNINNLRYADNTTLMAETEEELKSLLMKVKEEGEKIWLKAQHSEN